MRSPLGKKVAARFTDELKQRLPELEFAEKDPGFWVWRLSLGPDLTLFVYLQTFDRKDQFTVGVAWSENGMVPWGTVSEREVDQSRGRTRLARLWQESGIDPAWDLAPEHTAAREERLESLDTDRVLDYPPDPPIADLLPRIPALVHDAVDKLEEYGIPLLKRVAAARGLTWPAHESRPA